MAHLLACKVGSLPPIFWAVSANPKENQEPTNAPPPRLPGPAVCYSYSARSTQPPRRPWEGGLKCGQTRKAPPHPPLVFPHSPFRRAAIHTAPSFARWPSPSSVLAAIPLVPAYAHCSFRKEPFCATPKLFGFVDLLCKIHSAGVKVRAQCLEKRCRIVTV